MIYGSTSSRVLTGNFFATVVLLGDTIPVVVELRETKNVDRARAHNSSTQLSPYGYLNKTLYKAYK